VTSFMLGLYLSLAMPVGDVPRPVRIVWGPVVCLGPARKRGFV
jgi:hypothetical protein